MYPISTGIDIAWLNAIKRVAFGLLQPMLQAARCSSQYSKAAVKSNQRFTNLYTEIACVVTVWPCVESLAPQLQPPQLLLRLLHATSYGIKNGRITVQLGKVPGMGVSWEQLLLCEYDRIVRV